MIAALSETYAPQSIMGELHRFSVEDYEEMIVRGTLTDDDHVELLEGVIVQKMPYNAPHDHALNQLQLLLILMLERSWLVRTQSSFTSPRSVPEPDIAIIRGPASRYTRNRPTWEQAELVVEVYDSTLAKDRCMNMRIYYQAKVPAYWIVNLVDGVVEVCSQPKAGKAGGYRNCSIFAPADAAPVTLRKRSAGRIPVNEFLP